MELTIRIATARDAELIANLSRTTFYETFAPYNTKQNMDKFLTEQFTKGRLMTEVGAQNNFFFLAYYDNEIAGYLKLRDTHHPSQLRNKAALEIARLYATANMIGKGIGKMLMQKSIAIAMEKGKEILWLGVWEKNQRAIDFYHKWGFKKFGEHDFHLGNDLQCDWIMKKDLP